eukprot:TRINITY_DN2938_c0_g4_i4.p1 TRINITY_DN2938_c0_g4~~TRINITY_DN2938_c0_g4_i4.p1  ORF type:complete len:592 (+),score=174.84 TRINITY_DN2938_c0_g4_i4:129-1904(+)
MTGVVQIHELQQPLQQQHQLPYPMHHTQAAGVGFVSINKELTTQGLTPQGLFHAEDMIQMAERGSPEDPCRDIWAHVLNNGTPNTNSQMATSSNAAVTPPHTREINSAASGRSSYQHQPYTNDATYTPDLTHTQELDMPTMFANSSSRSPSRERGETSQLPQIAECIQHKMTESRNEVFDRKKDKMERESAAVKGVMYVLKNKHTTYDAACDYVVARMVTREVDSSLWWKLCYELAELHKKGYLPHAMIWLSVVIGLVPKGALGWAELAKIEEDLNHIDMAKVLFKKGLKLCTGVEKCTLTMKAIRLLEAFPSENSTRLIRKLVGEAVKDAGTTPERNWKVLLEGTLYEARQGRDKLAAKMFDCLMDSIPKQGTIYLEAGKFWEKNGDYMRAIEIVRRGLRANPKFGPLVFYGIRFLEKQAWLEYGEKQRTTEAKMRRMKGDRGTVTDKLFDLADSQEQEYTIDLSPIHDFRKEVKDEMCAELVWKLHFEVAQAEERAALYKPARKSFSMAFQACLPNLKWKVLVGGARMELARGNHEVAFKTLKSAYSILDNTQHKTMSIVKLELARFYEYTGHLDDARETLKEAQVHAV